MKLQNGATCGLAVLALAGLAASARAQSIAYEGFNYPAGAPLIGQSGGSGFSTPWQTAGYGSWSSQAEGMDFIKVWQLMQGQTGAMRSSSGGAQRTLTTPIAGTPGTSVWVSFQARHTGSASQSWLGVKLPCSGPGSDPFLFLGKPFGQSNWGTDTGLGGSVRQTSTPVGQSVRYVAKVTFNAGLDDVTVWLDPSMETSPPVAAAALHLPAYGNFADLRKLLVETGSGGSAVDNTIDEIRIGGTYADVSPVMPGLVLDGILQTPVGSATATVSSDGRKIVVGNIGSSGQDGVEVKFNSLSGGGVTISPQGPMVSGTEIKIKHKGWDGLIYGNHRARAISATETEFECDMSNSPSIDAIRMVAYDSGGVVVHDDTTPGPLAHVVVGNGSVGISGPCPGGGIPEWQYVTVFYNPPIYKNFDWIAFEKIWVFGCPGESHNLNRNAVHVYGIVSPGEPGLGGLESATITSTSPMEFSVSDAMVEFHSSSVQGAGDVVIREECDDYSQCATASRRRVRATGIGSSGQDGVEVTWRNSPPSTSGNFMLGDIMDSTGEATATIQSASGTVGPQMHVQGLGDDKAHVTPDFSGIGATECLMTAYSNGSIVRQEVLTVGNGIDIEAQIICGPGSVLVWGWVTMWVYCQPYPSCGGSWQTHWGVVGCMKIGTGGGGGATSTDRVVFAPINPTPGLTSEISSASITGRNISSIVLTDVDSTDTIPCAADFNADGFIDGFDYDDFVACFEGSGCPGTTNADFNQDGFADGFDYDDFVTAFENGC